MKIKIKITSSGAGLDLPRYETALSAGFDLRAAIPEGACVRLLPDQAAVISCGFAIAIPEGYEMQVRPRSGLAAKHGITVLNSPGTIDADYRGEVAAILINLGAADFRIRRGDRIAQGVIAPVTRAVFDVVEDLDETARGVGGFGSTGNV